MGILRRNGTGIRHRAALVMTVMATAALSLLAAGGDETEAGQQDFSEYEIKAAYLINFAKYVEWPDDAFEKPDSPFRIGILGDNPFGDTLEQLAREHYLGDHPMEIHQSDDTSDLAECHIVFVAASRPSNAPPDLSALAEKPVLTVGEEEGFAEEGGVINFVEVESRVKFEISLKEAKRVNLKMSSRLLQLAIKIYE